MIRASGITNNTEVAKTSIKFEYFKNYNMSEILELKDEFISLHSDFSVVAPVYKTAMLLSQRTPVYFYTFEYEGELSFSEYLLQPSASTELRDSRRDDQSSSDNKPRFKRHKRQSGNNGIADRTSNDTSTSGDFDTAPLDDRRIPQ